MTICPAYQRDLPEPQAFEVCCGQFNTVDVFPEERHHAAPCYSDAYFMPAVKQFLDLGEELFRFYEFQIMHCRTNSVASRSGLHSSR